MQVRQVATQPPYPNSEPRLVFSISGTEKEENVWAKSAEVLSSDTLRSHSLLALVCTVLRFQDTGITGLIFFSLQFSSNMSL